MASFSQKYTIICLLEKKKIGYSYDSKNWPLHITLADTFAITSSVDRLKAALQEFAINQNPVNLRGSYMEHFGAQQEIEVTIMDVDDHFIALHTKLVELLNSHGLVFNEPSYSGAGFRAHATVQKHALVRPGETVKIRNLALIDMFPGSDPYRRKIIGVFPFQRI